MVDVVKEFSWTDPTCKVSKWFTVREALWLPSWNRLATEADGLNQVIKDNLIDLFHRMDDVREFLGCPILVADTYRPPSYNALVGGKKASQHLIGNAVDWTVYKVHCDDIRKSIVPHLPEFGLRCENLPSSLWVHCDRKPVPPGGQYFFIP